METVGNAARDLSEIMNQIQEVNMEAKNANTIFHCPNLYPELSWLNCGTAANLEDDILKDKMTSTGTGLQITNKDGFM